MSYQVYTTKSKSTFVITRDAAGAEKAQASQAEQLGDLRLWKNIGSLVGIGMDPASTVERDLSEKGYHVQRTEIRIKED